MTPRRLLPGVLLAAAWTGVLWSQAPDPARWNKIFTDPKSNFNRSPNAFLVETVKPLKPGRAQWDLIVGIFMHGIVSPKAPKIGAAIRSYFAGRVSW